MGLEPGPPGARRRVSGCTPGSIAAISLAEHAGRRSPTLTPWPAGGNVLPMDARTTLDDLRENFELLESWEERYRYLIDLGKELPPMDDALKNAQTKVDGCLSQVWMLGRLDDTGLLRYLADSDATIVRGLIAVLMVAYDGRRPDEVLATDIDGLFDSLGLGQHISLNRRNGFFAMVQRIKAEAGRVAA